MVIASSTPFFVITFSLYICIRIAKVSQYSFYISFDTWMTNRVERPLLESLLAAWWTQFFGLVSAIKPLSLLEILSLKYSQLLDCFFFVWGLFLPLVSNWSLEMCFNCRRRLQKLLIIRVNCKNILSRIIAVVIFGTEILSCR